MKDFIGKIYANTIMKAISNAKEIKPDCKRFYGRVDDDKLILFVRKRMGDRSINEIPVAEQVIENKELIVEFDPEKGHLINGHPICISIPRYLHHAEMFGKRDILMDYDTEVHGVGVGCSL